MRDGMRERIASPAMWKLANVVHALRKTNPAAASPFGHPARSNVAPCVRYRARGKFDPSPGKRPVPLAC